jgi:8-oxo-dGTP pyrophosphatase MutT (NUDIX family)
VNGRVIELLSNYRPEVPAEAADVARIIELATVTPDPWQRGIPLHLTASALVVHPRSRRVLLRWHNRQQAWLMTGGHADPGETDPVTIAIREAREETGLTDLVPWPEPAVVQVAIVRVPANAVEPAHEHADVRFFLATDNPDAARPESRDAPLRWLTGPDAIATTEEENVREAVARALRRFG